MPGRVGHVHPNCSRNAEDTRKVRDGHNGNRGTSAATGSPPRVAPPVLWPSATLCNAAGAPAITWGISPFPPDLQPTAPSESSAVYEPGQGSQRYGKDWRQLSGCAVARKPFGRAGEARRRREGLTFMFVIILIIGCTSPVVGESPRGVGRGLRSALVGRALPRRWPMVAAQSRPPAVARLGAPWAAAAGSGPASRSSCGGCHGRPRGPPR